MTVVPAVAPTPSMFGAVSTPAFAIREVSFLVLAIAMFIFIVVAGLTVCAIVRFRRRPDDDGREPPQVYGSGSDRWDAWTLEWATTSPPPAYNFETAPLVASRRPLWDLKHPDDPDGPHE